MSPNKLQEEIAFLVAERTRTKAKLEPAGKARYSTKLSMEKVGTFLKQEPLK
ncbi:hypothetical protein GF360_00840 [candidate division WWE3 bacterium]|nr:hypothetical protein [candidate division WWE3 bacterium]